MGNILYVGAAIGLLFYHRPLMFNDLIAFASQYEFLEKRVLEELALPYAVMDMQGRMIWSNKVFSQITGRDQFYRKNVNTIFADITADKLPTEPDREITEISTQFGEHIYRVSMQRAAAWHSGCRGTVWKAFLWQSVLFCCLCLLYSGIMEMWNIVLT